MRKSVFAALAGALLLAGAAGAAEKLVIVPLSTSGDIPPAIAEGFRSHLRSVAEGAAAVLDGGAVQSALATSGAAPGCASDACADGIGGAAGARFVLLGAVDNTDEIYKVELVLYDRVQKKRQTAEGLCELCAAEEVDRTISVAFTKLRPALAAPPPVTRVAIEVTTDPEGADVALDGEVKGQSPIVLRTAPGAHVVRVSKDGMKPVEREVTAEQQTVKLSIPLVPEPASAAPTPTPAPTPIPTPPVAAPPVAPPPTVGEVTDDSSYTYTGAGMVIGGALLTAGGIVAILLDGDVTCADGLGIRECPTVYNTKGVGIAGLGIGAGLLGAGVTLIVVDLLDDPPVAPSAALTPEGPVLGLGGRF